MTPPARTTAASPAVIPAAPLRITCPRGEVHAKVVISDEEQERGLSGRDGMAGDEGMLFVLADDPFRGFWMKGCRFPLDVVLLDGDHRVLHVSRDVPLDASEEPPIYRPVVNAAFMLELNAGAAARHGIVAGANLAW